MGRKVCITAAGRGRRAGLASGTNKALLPVGRRSVLTRIIDQFPPDTEFVLAVGHEARKVKDFLALAAPARNITCVEVDNFEGPGSGPGYSLLKCRDHLQCPFTLVACDTLVSEPVPEPEENWIGIAPVDDPTPFLVAALRDTQVVRFFDKQSPEAIAAAGISPETVARSAFIGLAGIRDFERFWAGLAGDPGLIAGEWQVSNGLSALVEAGLKGIEFTWFDTGTDQEYRRAVEHFGGSYVLEKPGEFLYFEDRRVIKFFRSAQRAADRVARARLLRDVVPGQIEARDHFYAYNFVPGRRLSEVTDADAFSRFLDFAAATIWRSVPLDAHRQAEFRAACARFYWDKTLHRINAFHEKTGLSDAAHVINGEPVPTVKELLDRVDWERLNEGTAVRFHGDPQPENIIVTDDGRFVMLDWREDFGGLLDFGDLYYDLAKLHHALIISGKVIRNSQFHVAENGKTVEYDFRVRHNLLRFLRIFEDFIARSGWEVERVRLLTSLIYLNIAPLHCEPYDRLLYYHGKLALKRVLEGQWPIWTS